MAHGKTRSVIALAIVFVCGCGLSSSDHPSAQLERGPDRVVSDFLEAVRVGNHERAGELLSPLARQRTAEMEMVVAPPGSDTAKFRVGHVEVVDAQAQVHSEWTDLDSDGLLHTDEIVWLVRRDAEGWRIVGMSTEVFADRDPVLLNFEEPEEMLRQQQLAEEELARREHESSSAAPAPASQPVGQRR